MKEKDSDFQLFRIYMNCSKTDTVLVFSKQVKHKIMVEGVRCPPHRTRARLDDSLKPFNSCQMTADRCESHHNAARSCQLYRRQPGFGTSQLMEILHLQITHNHCYLNAAAGERQLFAGNIQRQ